LSASQGSIAAAGLIAKDGIFLRQADAADASFLRQLFEQVRTAQFTATGLSGPIVGQIMEQQFRSQAAGYTVQFPDAVSLIVTRDGGAIGRLLLDCTHERWHVIDVVLLPADCGRGLGSEIFAALEASARERGIAALTLMVLSTNLAAHRFYLRRGFVETGQAGPAHRAMRKDLA
jgi:ribosomal protein S18 acetylase RimI-like enzyme